MTEPLLTARNLSKSFRKKGGDDVVVLKGVDLDLAEGDRVAIVGKSGSGKSTLLHLLGTLEQPSGGDVRFKGTDVFRLGEGALSAFRNRSLGFVFQFHYLMLEFTALENVMMPALIAGESRGKARARAKDLLNRVGLEKRLDHKPGQLSGGEQQRVSIARALVMGPKLLLTDEMTGNLDPATGSQVFQLVSDIHREFGMALVSVTHDESLAASYGRIYRLTEGKLVPS